MPSAPVGSITSLVRYIANFSVVEQDVVFDADDVAHALADDRRSCARRSPACARRRRSFSADRWSRSRPLRNDCSPSLPARGSTP